MKKKVTIEQIRRDVVLKMLPHIPFDGWSVVALNKAMTETKYSKDILDSAFNNGVRDAIYVFARYIDDQMLIQLQKLDCHEARIRDKIIMGVQTRLKILENYKEAERLAIGFWALPSQTLHGLRSVWQTADIIWDWAGDTSTDYNRYTKRGLLSGVLAKTILYWLNDVSMNYQDTDAFLDRRIDNVLSMGKMIGGVKNSLDRLWNKVPFKASRV